MNAGKALKTAGRWRGDSTVPERVYVQPTEDQAVGPFAAVPLGGFAEGGEKPPSGPPAARAPARTSPGPTPSAWIADPRQRPGATGQGSVLSAQDA